MRKIRFKKAVKRFKGITVKGYRFGKKVHTQAKEEFQRIQKQRQDERLRGARRDYKRLKQRKKELKKFKQIASLKEELRKARPKARRDNFFDVKF